MQLIVDISAVQQTQIIRPTRGKKDASNIGVEDVGPVLKVGFLDVEQVGLHLLSSLGLGRDSVTADAGLGFWESECA